MSDAAKSVSDELEQQQTGQVEAEAAEVANAEAQTRATDSEGGEAVEGVVETAAETQTQEASVSVDALQQQVADLREALLRQQAEMENQRKRLSRDVENAHKYGLERLINELLPIKDSMEMEQEAASKEDVDVTTLKEGSALILKMLDSTLEKFGVQAVEAEGEKFDPQLHEAMSMVPVPDAEPNTVIMVQQKGYLLNERLLRPARVIVAKGE